MKNLRFQDLTLLAVLVAGACLTTGAPRVIDLPDRPAQAVSHVSAIRDYDVAVASITAVLERDFNIPRYPVSFQFFPDRQAFEEGLRSLGYPDALARDTAKTMDAVGGHRRVMLNEAAISRQLWPARVASLAHELAHSLQYEVGGGRRGASDQWLREGFAEWVALQVLHRLHGIKYPEARRRYQAVVRRAGRTRAPALRDMVTFPQWVELNGSRGIPAYPLAFLAVDFLIERHGLEAAFNYFRLFAASQDRVGNFRTAFDEDLDAFEAALATHLW
jgi:hypothetical protein